MRIVGSSFIDLSERRFLRSSPFPHPRNLYFTFDRVFFGLFRVVLSSSRYDSFAKKHPFDSWSTSYRDSAYPHSLTTEPVRHSARVYSSEPEVPPEVSASAVYSNGNGAVSSGITVVVRPAPFSTRHPEGSPIHSEDSSRAPTSSLATASTPGWIYMEILLDEVLESDEKTLPGYEDWST